MIYRLTMATVFILLLAPRTLRGGPTPLVESPPRGTPFDYSERGLPRPSPRLRQLMQQRKKVLSKAERQEMEENSGKVKELFGEGSAKVDGAADGYDNVQRVYTPDYELHFPARREYAFRVLDQGVFVLPETTWPHTEAKIVRSTWEVQDVEMPEGYHARLAQACERDAVYVMLTGRQPDPARRTIEIYQYTLNGKGQRVVTESCESKNFAIDGGSDITLHSRIAPVTFFRWGKGYGFQWTALYESREPRVDESSIHLTCYDASFKKLWQRESVRRYIVPVGPNRKWAIAQSDGGNLVVYQRNRPVKRVPFETDSTYFPHYARHFIPSEALTGDYVVFPKVRSERIPVFNVGTFPPRLASNITIGGPPSNMVTSAGIAVEDRVFLQQGGSRVITARPASGKLDEPVRLNRFAWTPQSPELRRKFYWQRYIPGTETRKVGFFGHRKKHLIVPGRANIFFIDPETGLVNYRFCTLYKPGRKIVPDKEWIQWTRDERMYNEIHCWGIFNDHLIATSDNHREPFYIWRLPDELVRRAEKASHENHR